MTDTYIPPTDPKQIKLGDVIQFDAPNPSGTSADDKITFTAMVYNLKLGVKDELHGFEVFIIAPPGTYKGGYSTQSVAIQHIRHKQELGLAQDENHRVHLKAVTVGM